MNNPYTLILGEVSTGAIIIDPSEVDDWRDALSTAISGGLECCDIEDMASHGSSRGSYTEIVEEANDLTRELSKVTAMLDSARNLIEDALEILYRDDFDDEDVNDAIETLKGAELL